MPRKIIVDAGPIIAYFDRKDEYHNWAAEQFGKFAKFETCDAVLAEACARLAYAGFDQTAVIRLADEGVLSLTFNTGYNLGRILALMEKYSDQPMDFADACLVAMSEEHDDSLVITLDQDFKCYRRRGRDKIPLLAPGS
jgi:predicted nucleic acid-binding protein